MKAVEGNTNLLPFYIAGFIYPRNKIRNSWQLNFDIVDNAFNKQMRSEVSRYLIETLKNVTFKIYFTYSSKMKVFIKKYRISNSLLRK